MTSEILAKLEIPNFPANLKREVKLQAVSEDKSVKQWVIEALTYKLKVSDKSRR
jgi:hydrogenase maturation factor